MPGRAGSAPVLEATAAAPGSDRPAPSFRTVQGDQEDPPKDCACMSAIVEVLVEVSAGNRPRSSAIGPRVGVLSLQCWRIASIGVSTKPTRRHHNQITTGRRCYPLH